MHGHQKRWNSGNCTHSGFFDNLDILEGVLDADFGAIASRNKFFDRGMKEGSIESFSVQHPTATDTL
jgi:hypothetical protein